MKKPFKFTFKNIIFPEYMVCDASSFISQQLFREIDEYAFQDDGTFCPEPMYVIAKNVKQARRVMKDKVRDRSLANFIFGGVTAHECVCKSIEEIDDIGMIDQPNYAPYNAGNNTICIETYVMLNQILNTTSDVLTGDEQAFLESHVNI